MTRIVQGEGGKEDGGYLMDLGPSNFVYVELYKDKAGTVSEVIGAEARAQAAAAEIINDTMARLKNALISEDEFMQYMIGRGGQEAAQVCP